MVNIMILSLNILILLLLLLLLFLISLPTQVIRKVPDKLAVITYLHLLRSCLGKVSYYVFFAQSQSF